MHVMGWKLFALLQCFVEWFAISGEEMLGVDTYQTLYNRRGIEGGQPIYRRCADCWKISCSTFVLLTYLSFFCIALSTIVCLLFYFLLFTSNADYPFGIANLYLSIIYPSDIGDLSRFWLSSLRAFDCIAPKALNDLAFQSFDFERTWWRLLWKRVVRTKFDIYVFIITLTRINIFYVQNVLVEVESTGTFVRDIQIFDS